MVVSIAGMHRSGTSMIARLLNLCGLYLGPKEDIYPPAEDNTEGFWENKKFVEINTEILGEFGGSWDLPPALQPGWQTSDHLAELRERAQGLIEEFKPYDVWGWKDPRNSLTLPFWQDLIPNLKVIICLRNPHEVAQSLSKRGYTSFPFSYNLWQVYSESLAPTLPAGSYLITHYESYFINPKAELMRVLDFIGLQVQEDLVEQACITTSSSHKHHRSTVDEVLATKAPGEVLKLYVEMCAQAGDVFWGRYAPDLKKTVPVVTQEEPELSQTGLLLRLNEKHTLLATADREIKTQLGIIKAKDETIKIKDETIKIKDETIRAKDEKIQHLQARLTQTEYDLRILHDSLAFKFLSRYRKFIARYLPEGTKRRKLYGISTRTARVFFKEGPRGVWERIQARRRTMPQKKTSKRKGGDLGQQTVAAPGDQSRLEEIYADALSIATGETRTEYVPISDTSFSALDVKTKLIAFYLPQFHPIPENNQWWGAGFTEWSNVAKAVPQFTGHYQPHLPGELGFYDLRLAEVQRRQVQLAKQYGVFGFCFYYYWFNGKRLLERPLDQFISDPEIDFPFCLCWANENWTRRWDGQESEILIGQNHSVESDIAFIKDVEPYLRHKNYIKVGGRPVLIVYRPQIMPDPAGTAQRWKEYCREQGLGDLYLVAAQTFGLSDPRQVGFEAAVEFPPHGVVIPEVTDQVEVLNPNYAGKIYNYQHVVGYMMQKKAPDYPLFRTVMTAWDNTARRQNHAHIFIHANPSTYQSWLSYVLDYTERNLPVGERLVFINAWNEWAEGTHLEPDRKYGYAYLQSTMLALQSTNAKQTSSLISSFGKIQKQHDTAVILHIYYPELWDEINSYLLNLQGQFDLFVSLPDSVKFDTTMIQQHYPQAHIYRCENRGRDIAPFLTIFSAVFSYNYKYICKIHTKKTAHREDGDLWRRDLLDKLLGSQETVKTIKELLDKSDIGIVAPSGHVLYLHEFIAENEEKVKALTQKAGLTYHKEANHHFVAGSMFWFKPMALSPLRLMSISVKDFEPEKGLKVRDGTLAHAFERFFGPLAEQNGFRIEEVGEKSDKSKYRFAFSMGRYSSKRHTNMGVNLRATVKSDPILVFQVGKVGSRTVKLSLIEAYKQLALDVPIYNAHVLNNLEQLEENIQKNVTRPIKNLEKIREFKLVRGIINSNPEQHWNLISLVREPVARNVGAFFQNLSEYIPDWKERYEKGDLGVGELQEFFLNTKAIHVATDWWFNTQLKPFFDINVFDSPFPVEAGYKIYNNSPRASLLLIRLENLNSCAERAMNEFLGLEKFELINTNIGEDKDYAEVYHLFKELPLPQDYVEKMYNSRYARHFYSQTEIDAFMKRWTG